MTVTCTICNKTEPTQEQFERFHIPTHEHVRMMSAYEKGIEAGEYKQAAELARLTAGSEAMQEDARNNTATINAQAEEIRTLKGIARNLAKHLEAINNICERGDEFIPTEVGRAIRKHCESANVMEAL